MSTFSNLLKFTLVLCTLFAFHVLSQKIQCPSQEVISPCVCKLIKGQKYADLYCNLTKDDNFKEIIDKINENGVNGNEQRFRTLTMINGDKYRITDRFFGNVSFENIYFGNNAEYTKIKFISCGAFDGISHRVRNFIIRSDFLKNSIELFGAISRLTNLESLGLEARFSVLPTNALRTPKSCYPSLSCVQNKLKSIKFKVGVNSSLIYLEEIEGNVFYDLPNLQSISFDSQDIYYVYKNAFAFANKSETTLNISITNQWNRNFKGESFEIGAFENINRPVILDLSDSWEVKFLDEAVFRPFLDADPRNKIKLAIKQVCDCKMYWLFKDRHKYMNRFIRFIYQDKAPKVLSSYTIMCSANILDFWQRTEENFNKCQ